MKTRHRTRRHSRKHKGAGYGFGGSLLSDAGGSNGGNAAWVSDTGADCGNVAGRAGNNLAGGRRRRRRSVKKGGQMSNASLAGRGGNNVTGGRRRRHTRKHRKGGAYVDMAQEAPRTGYGFNGSGVAGTANTIPY